MDHRLIEGLMEAIAPLIKSYVDDRIAKDLAPLRLQVAEYKSIMPERGEPGLPGKDADPEYVLRLVEETVAKVPPAAAGKDASLEDIKAAVLNVVADVLPDEVAAAIEKIEKPKDGKDADPEVIRSLVSEEVAKIDPPNPADSLAAAAAVVSRPLNRGGAETRLRPGLALQLRQERLGTAATRSDMNELSPAKRRALKHLLAMGASRRAIAAAVGCSTNTVKRYAKVWTFSPICACGKPAGHNGWCHARLAFSPARRGWLADHWKMRGSSEIATVVDEGCRRAAANGHTLGRFVWAAAATSALAYATCVECGQSVRVNDGGLRRDRLDGTAHRTAAQGPSGEDPPSGVTRQTAHRPFSERQDRTCH
jgi:hypothetical protein